MGMRWKAVVSVFVDGRKLHEQNVPELPVVSYAVPALVAIGQARYFHRPPRNPLVRLVRRLALKGSLRTLQDMQPTSGGYLEAVPLTSFVVTTTGPSLLRRTS